MAGCRCEKCKKILTDQFDAHHKKRRSALRPGEGSGGIDNIAILCIQCHRDLHDGRPGFERFKINSWEPIERTQDAADAFRPAKIPRTPLL